MVDVLKEYVKQLEQEVNQNIINSNLILKIIDEISNIMNNFKGTEEEIIVINDNLNELFIAMQDGDYLRFLDILKYEVLPLLDSIF